MNATMNAEPTAEPTDNAILDALRRLLCSRPGLSPDNYGSARAYWRDQRRISRDLRRAESLLLDVADAPVASAYLRRDVLAQTGRVQYRDGRMIYIAGQYYPIEYRAAIAALLAEALEYAERKARVANNQEPQS